MILVLFLLGTLFLKSSCRKFGCSYIEYMILQLVYCYWISMLV